MGENNKGLFGLLAGLVLGAVLGIVVIVSTGNNDSTNAVAEVADPTAVPDPTEAPDPTEVPDPTAVPTAVPDPTAEPDPTVAAEPEPAVDLANIDIASIDFDDPALAASGQALYEARCAGCHGTNGEGVSAPALVGLAGRTEPSQNLALVIDGGARMPAFGSQLEQGDIVAVVSYARSFAEEVDEVTECIGLCVRLDSATVQDGELLIAWSAEGFIPDEAGQHVHFFYDIFAPEQAGTNWAELGAASEGAWVFTDQQPFSTAGTDVSVANAPPGTTGICVVAAETGHGAVNPENAECWAYPADLAG